MEGERIPVFGEESDLLSAQELIRAQGSDTRPVILPPLEAGQRSWTQQGGSADHAPQRVEFSGAGDLIQAWSLSFTAPPSPAQAIRPVTGDGRGVCVGWAQSCCRRGGGERGRVCGRRRSAMAASAGLTCGGLALSGGRLFVTTGFGALYALSAEDGSELWRAVAGEPVRSAPTAGPGRVFFVTNANRVIALSADDGSVLWTQAGAQQQVFISYSAAPALQGSSLIVPASTGEFIALVAGTGAQLWSEQAGGFSAEGGFRSPGLPVINGGQGMLLGPTGLAVIDLASGAVSWEVRMESDQQPWVAGSHLFVADAGSLIAFRRDDGAVRWAAALESDAESGGGAEGVAWFSPRLTGEGLLVVSSVGDLRIVDPDSGVETFRGSLPEAPLAAPIIGEGLLLYSTAGGKVVALRPR